MTKTIYLFLLAVLVTLGSCKKSCKFPQYQDGQYCFDVKDVLIGDYYGVEYYYYNASATSSSSQDIVEEVIQGRNGPANVLFSSGVSANVDAQGNITIPKQGFIVPPNYHYSISGTGFFGDTVLYGKNNKSLYMDITWQYADSLSTAYISRTIFTGIR